MSNEAVPGAGADAAGLAVCVVAGADDRVALALTLADVGQGADVLVVAPEAALAWLPDEVARVALDPGAAPGVAAACRAVARHWGARDFVCLRAGVHVLPDSLAILAAAAGDDDAVALVSPLSDREPFLSLGIAPPGRDLAELNGWLRDNAAGRTFDVPAALDSCCWVRFAALAGFADAAVPADRGLSAALAERGYLSIGCAQVYVDDRAVPVQALLSSKAGAERPDTIMARLREALATAGRVRDALPSRPVRLHITHNWGGGVAGWVADFAAADTACLNLVLRSVSGWDARCYALELLYAERMDEPLLRWPLELPIDASVVAHHQYRGILHEVIELTGARSLVVSSLVGHSLDALATGLPTVVVQHDYYPYCPALFLHFGEVCTTCERPRLESCLADNEHNILRGRPEAGRWLALREHYVRRMLAEGVVWVAPSESVFRNLVRIEPRLAAKPRHVVEHGLADALRASTAGAPAAAPPAGGRLRVFVMGRLAQHKGQALFKAALPALLPHAEFVLVGCGTYCESFADVEGVHAIADYRPAELAGLVATWRPDCALLMSLVPETFSYTLSEISALGVPTLATRMGALADRIEDGVTGLLFEPTAEALVAAVTALAADRAPLRRIAEQLAGRPFRGLDAMVADYRRLLPTAAGQAGAASRFPAADLLDELLRAHASETVLRHSQADLLGRIERQEAERRESAERERETAGLLAETQAELETARRQLGESETRLEETAARLEETAARLDEAGGQLKRSENKAEAYRAEVEARGAHIETLTAKLAGVQGELDAVLDSTLWKATAPLRWLVLRLRRLARMAGQAAAALRSLPGVAERAGGWWPAVMKTAGVLRRYGVAGLKERARLRVAIDADAPNLLQAAPASAAAPQRVYAQLVAQAAGTTSEYVGYRADEGVDSRLRAIAFYLPQFHPIPENDAWWGRGFTEWTNVAKAVPQFVGHYQPRLPGELGHYDLRLPEVQRRQVELARQYGLSGFCFYYYWFSGQRLLERPIEQFVANPDIDFPFCLCWANENWTRRWDGRNDDILMRQLYREEDEQAFIDSVIPYFRDPRYIRVDGRPVLLVYRVDELPVPERAVATWRAACQAAGVGDPYLLMVQFHTDDPRPYGFDGAVEFPPHLPDALAQLATEKLEIINPDYRGIVYDYQAMAGRTCERAWPDYAWYRGVMPSWDNEARKPGRGSTFHGASPAAYARWLAHAAWDTDRHNPAPDRKLMFINAWNEWGEGAYLEPDRRYGYAYLQATADVLRGYPAKAGHRIAVVSHNALFHGAQLLALNMARCLREQYGYEVHVILCGDGPLRAAYAEQAIVHDWYAMAEPERRATVDALVGLGITKAICNTSVVGDVVEQLAAAGVRCVSLIHELPVLIRAHGLEASIARIAAHAEKLVFPAGYVQDRFLGIQPVAADKIVVRPQGLYRNNPDRHHKARMRAEVGAELGLPKDAPVVLGVGFADHRKGIDLFAWVAAEVTAVRPQARFVWVGPKDDLELGRHQEVVAPLLERGQLIFTGPRDPAGRYYAAADLYLLTSREDPFPSVVLEALDAGMPVVAFEDGGGYTELLREGWGDLVAMEDTAAMAEAVLARLAADADERSRFAADAEVMIRQRFVFADYLRDLLALLDERTLQVSVIVPNYNYARYLGERLHSILAQTRKPREIVFLDDCSSDDSVAVAEAILAAGDVPYRIVRNASNKGCFRQWLGGIEAAAGDLVWIAEADDIAEPRFLETLVPFFEDDEVVLAYSQSKQIDEEGAVIAEDYLAYTDEIDPDKWRTAYVRPGVDEIRDTLVVKNTIPNVSAVVMRRPDLEPIADTLFGLRNAGDWLVYLHLLEQGKVAYHPAALNRHRRHGGGLTLGEGRRRLMREILAVQACYMERHPPAPAVRELIEAVDARTYEYLGLDSAASPHWRDDAEFAGARLEQACTTAN